MTTGSGRGHPEPRRRHRRGSRLGLLQVRVLFAELRRWRRQAACYGLTLSEFVRSVMNNSKIRVAAVADPQLLHELKRHGILLNQLLHATHAGYPVDPKRVEGTIDALRSLYAKEIGRG